MNDIAKKLQELNIQLPKASTPAARYVPCKIVDKMVYISGQLPFQTDGSLITGIVKDDSDMEKAGRAAYFCGLNIISQLGKLIDSDWSRFDSMVKLGGFVSSSASFTKQPLVIDHASSLMYDVFGDAGKHSRFAIGVASLPLNAMVEIEAIALLK